LQAFGNQTGTRASSPVQLSSRSAILLFSNPIGLKLWYAQVRPKWRQPFDHEHARLREESYGVATES
jgi:hypothetical protein